MNPINSQKNKSLRFSFLDGVFASGMVGFTQEYFTPFLLILGATAKHIGVLNALPNLVASLIQLKSADLVEKIKSRKKIINIFVFLQALMLLPMAFIALIGAVSPALFIAMVVMFTSFGALANPAWGSLMSDLVKEEKRGEYFGWRNRTLGFIIVAATFIAGIILHNFKKINVFDGFVIIFSFAAIFRIISWYFLKKMHEPSLEYNKGNSFTLLNFLSKIKKSNFAKFVLFVSMMNFSVNISAPFFAVLMLKDLHFSYMLYTVITATATLTIYLTIARWGRQADKIGNLKVIKFVSPLIGIIPLLWIINRHPIFLVFAQIFSGFLWAGFNLCASNFIYDSVTSAKRTRCIAYFSALNGIALCGGSLLGGFLLQKLPNLFGYKILSLFLLSSVLRILVGIFMPMKLKEVRPIEKISNNKLFFSIIGMKPLLGVERKTVRY
ncbi:MAG: MFS transporter [Candidatus Omnitrophica bacterium]|nr:MFS transporter [Candidatus Omnitrophota bacterium]